MSEHEISESEPKKAKVRLAKTYGCAVHGIKATLVTVETNISSGVNLFIVGLPDSAVKESQHRIGAALKNIGHKIPGKGVTINMAPADIKKEGSAYDLTMAIGILAADDKIRNENLGEYIIMGELSLDGELRSIKGVLPIAIEAKTQGFKGIILPKLNAQEAAAVGDLEVLGATTIQEVIDFFNEEQSLEKTVINISEEFYSRLGRSELDFADVKGQENIKRALEIAAAGGHNVIMIGPPGAGKTMIAKRLPTILPPLTIEESLETTKIHSVAGKMSKGTSLVTSRPFRSPHHTISDFAIYGRGVLPHFCRICA
jgi:magnesium chelatase family protein